MILVYCIEASLSSGGVGWGPREGINNKVGAIEESVRQTLRIVSCEGVGGVRLLLYRSVRDRYKIHDMAPMTGKVYTRQDGDR